MATASEILRATPDKELQQAVTEALDWNKTGILRGDVLRAISTRLESEAGIEPDGMLRDADTLICREAARRFAEIELKQTLDPANNVGAIMDRMPVINAEACQLLHDAAAAI